jgi:predicted PurR-regulated permease PerM
MNYCECSQILDRVNRALQQLINSMISARNAGNTSMTDSGQILNSQPEVSSEGQLVGGMLIVGIVFLIIFAFFLRAIEWNNRQAQIENRNEDNKEKNLSSTFKKL